jgi:hypothetical protein
LRVVEHRILLRGEGLPKEPALELSLEQLLVVFLLCGHIIAIVFILLGCMLLEGVLFRSQTAEIALKTRHLRVERVKLLQLLLCESLIEVAS